MAAPVEPSACEAPAAALAGWDAETVAEVVRRVCDPGRERWLEQVRGCGYCARPVRLRGRVVHRSGGRRARTMYSTSQEPDGMLFVRCHNRRAAVCPSCSYEYRGDVWQLINAGAAGGRKGVPESVRDHPMVFCTLTAPSFGRVHTRPDGRGPCHPGSDSARCPHGRLRSCPARHAADDPCLGEPLCPDCYDYDGAVLFNWSAPELWRRLTIALRRALARRLGLTERRFGERFRVSYAKVAEFQRRGVVHLHLIVRLDGGGEPFAPLSHPVAVSTLADAVRQAAANTRVALRPCLGGEAPRVIGFGREIDVRPLHASEQGTNVTAEAVAAYISKYATKGADDLGVGERRLRNKDLAHLELREHVVRLVETVWRLGTDIEGLRRWAHMLGFRGHFATKSRRYSTTLGALRAARAEHQRARAGWSPRPEADKGTTLVVGEWAFGGIGYASSGDAALARAAAAHARERQQLRRLEALAD